LTDLHYAQVLVTGGAGFLGSAIVEELLTNKATVTVFDNLSSGRIDYLPSNSNVKLVKGDVTSAEETLRVLKGIEYVIHAATLPFIPDSFLHPNEFFQVNVGGTINMDSIRTHEISFQAPFKGWSRSYPSSDIPLKERIE